MSNIIDSNGVLVYSGNPKNPKFAVVLARAGHSRIDVEYPHLTKPKWDGAKWIEGETVLEVWQKKMAESDGSLMPRYLEDLITDKFAGDAGTSLQERYLAKIKIRGERP
jgi:hypothetical protein